MPHDMLSLIKSFPEFAEKGFSLGIGGEGFHKESIRNIVYCGMGGSAISGDIIREILFRHLEIPFNVVRNYHIPYYADEHTLIILSSFSGNTEETISCAEEAMRNKCSILSICSGGMIADLMKNNKNSIQIDMDLPPRTALPITLFALLRRLCNMFELNSLNEQLNEAINFMNNYNMDDDKIISEAEYFENKIPILYCDEAYSSTVRRAANQLSENCKQFAHFNVLPEMNHNEIVGLLKPKGITDNTVIIFYKFQTSDDRINHRINVTEQLLTENGFTVKIVEFSNCNEIINVVDSILYSDLLSYHLAVKNNVDPVEIKRIDLLKERMKY